MIFCGLLLLVAEGAAASIQYADTIRFRFATVEEGQALLGTDDAFTRGWSEFDIFSRLQKISGTKAELIAFKQREVRAWTQEEKELIWQDMLARQPDYPQGGLPLASARGGGAGEVDDER